MRMTKSEQEDFETLLEDAEPAAETDWEIIFVDDMRNKYMKYGADVIVSDRQMEKLQAIAGRR